jgi:hypothetical protein
MKIIRVHSLKQRAVSRAKWSMVIKNKLQGGFLSHPDSWRDEK